MGAVQHMVLAKGLRPLAVARRFSLPPSSVYRWVRRAASPPAPSPKQRAVAQRRRLAKKLAAEVIKKTGDRGVYGNKDPVVMQRRRYPSCVSIAGEIRRRTGAPCSAGTIRRDLLCQGLRSRVRPTGPRRREGDKAARLEFCNRHRAPTGYDYLFSDEKWADCNDHGGRREWVMRGQAPLHMERDRFSPKLLVWGLIGVGVKVSVMFEEGATITHQTYLERCIRPHLRLLTRPNTVFVQDNARPHISREVQAELHQHQVLLPLPQWPALSPDLSPIETLWAIIQRQVDRHCPANATELRQAWQHEWDTFPQSEIDNLVREFHQRCEAVVRNDGATLHSHWRKLLR
mgnify:CR=1 FL=1